MSHAKGEPGEHTLGRSSTFADIDDYKDPDATFDSTGPRDPVRHALLAGRTVASNAGFAAAEVAGKLPGSTYTVEGPDPVEIPVAVRWEKEFAPGIDAPDSIRIILSQVGRECRAICGRYVEAFEPELTEGEFGLYETSVTLPSDWTDGYVRVEVVGRFVMPGTERPVGAFVSPVFLRRNAQP